MRRFLSHAAKDKTVWTLSGLALVAMLIGVLIYVMLRPLPPAPVVYKRIDYDPRSVCAGEAVSYTVYVDIVSAPSVLTGVESWWSVEGNFTAIPGDKFTTAIYTEPISLTRVTSITVPARLPSGHYEYRRASYANSLPAIFTLPVTVTTEGCE